MVRIFAWLGMLGQSLVACLLPALQSARGVAMSKGFGTGVRWVLHVVIIVLILVGLHFLNQAFHLDELIRANPFIRRNFLPILFVLIYLLGWLILLLYQLLRTDDRRGAFPDIDAAWAEAMAALEQAGVGIASAPLFLVLGHPEGDERVMFQAAQLQLAMPPTPGRADAPIRLYAARRAMFLTCPGVSAVSLQASVLTGEAKLSGAAATVLDESSLIPGEDDDPLAKTMRPDQGGQAVGRIGNIMKRAERERRGLTDWERRQIRAEERRDNPRNSILAHRERLELLNERLSYLCKLVLRTRYPYCPINGILLCIPFAGTDHTQDATDTGKACAMDLAAARQTLKVHCPVVVLLCDVETVPGFAEFIERFTPQEKLQRVGQRCPLAPDFSRGVYANGRSNPVGEMMDSLSSWICNSVMPSWVYKKFQMENRQGAEDVAAAVQHNARLYLLADELRERRNRLSAILSHGLAEQSTDPPLIGGCYIAGTGREPKTGQAFVAGVLNRLEQEQDCVSWSAETLEEEARYARWTSVGWGVLAAAAIVTVMIFVYFNFIAD